MRDIDSNIMAQLEAEELRPFKLIDMEIDGTHYRYTDCDVPIAIGDNLFNPRGFKSQPIQYSLNKVIDQVKLEIDNLDDELTSAFVGGIPQGSDVSLKLAVLDSDYAVIASPQTLFEGFINGWGLTEEKLSLTVSSIFNRWSQKTLAKHSASCRWKVFKGAECGYSGGETWCDRSYARCAALSNTNNFGGFRWLPSIVDREIWWGKNRAV